jgi:hypothetical protein
MAKIRTSQPNKKETVVEIKPSSTSPVFMNAMLVLALSIIWKTGLFAFGYHQSLVGQFSILLVLLFLLIGLFRTVDQIRISKPDQKLQFVEGFKAGARVVLLISAGYSLFVWFYYKNIDVTFFDQLIQNRINEGLSRGIDPIELEKFRKSAPTILSASTRSFFTFIGLLVGGIVYAYAITWLMVKKYQKKIG